jgi:uncharacterized protein (TIGR00645 family)
MKAVERTIENLIFFSRWVQAPMYIGLIGGSILYAVKFFIELYHMIIHFSALTDTTIMLAILGLVDATMVANLLIVVIIGGYTTFVSKLDMIHDSEDKPSWLEGMNANGLKIKLVASLVSISGVHLLKSFINIKTFTTREVVLQVVIHLVFVISALILAITDKVMHSVKHK